jgi:hypothetical protein
MPTVNQNLKRYIKEEYEKLNEEVAEEAETIAEELEKLREKLEKEGAMDLPESLAMRTIGGTMRCKRLELKTVAELLDRQINELMLYFLNHVKVANEGRLVEYHLGYAHFYAKNRFQSDTP